MTGSRFVGMLSETGHSVGWFELEVCRRKRAAQTKLLFLCVFWPVDWN